MPDPASRLRAQQRRRDAVRERERAVLAGVELTPTQLEVALLVEQGYSNAEIATRLAKSPRTIETHIEEAARRIADAGVARGRPRERLVRWAAATAAHPVTAAA